MNRRILVSATAIAATVTLIGCSSSTSSAPTTSGPGTASPPTSAAAPSPQSTTTSAHSSAAQHSVAMITIKNFAFHISGTVMPGATVHVTNDDSTAHTVTSDSGNAFDVTVDPGKSATLTAPHARGGYKFHCNFHSDMHGTLVVK
jgi:plastocyanin